MLGGTVDKTRDTAFTKLQAMSLLTEANNKNTDWKEKSVRGGDVSWRREKRF